MFAALMQVRPRMLLDFVIVIIPKFSASTTALWATQPPPRLICWLLAQAPTAWPHTLRCTLFSEGLFWIINFIPQLVLSQNPFENLLSIVDSLAENAYVQMHTDCSACTDVTAPGSPETQGQWVSTCGRSPTATVFLTFPFSLKIRDFYYFFRLSYGLFVIHSFLWKKRKAEGQCTFLVLSHLSLHQHRP